MFLSFKEMKETSFPASFAPLSNSFANTSELDHILIEVDIMTTFFIDLFSF